MTYRSAASCLATTIAMGFVGCQCGEAPVAPTTSATSTTPLPAPPLGEYVGGWFCPVRGDEVAEGAQDFQVGPVGVRANRFWTPILPALLPKGGWGIQHRMPGDVPAMLVARNHVFPPGTRFDTADAQRTFDVIAADAEAYLHGTRAITWGGRPAVEGAISRTLLNPGKTRFVTHHLIVQAKGTEALVASFTAPEAQYHRYLSEACGLVKVAKP